MAGKKIQINRAPVLTLWATVVAERLGFKAAEALTLGKGVAGLNAQSKGRSLGIFKAGKETAKKAREREEGEVFMVEICGRPVPAVNTPEGLRAAIKGKPIDPESVSRYLEQKFGEDLPAVRTEMQGLARAYSPKELADAAFPLYERFRPEIPAGRKGWGALGELDLGQIRALARTET